MSLKILQLSPQFVFPSDDGGKISIANILKQFHREGHQVTFFCFVNENIPKKYIIEAEKYCDLILYPHSTKNTFSRILKAVIYNRSIYISKHTSNEITKELDRIADENDFDVVHADHTCMAPLAYHVKKRKNIPMGLRLHNVEWLIWHRYSKGLLGWHPKSFFIQNQAYLLREIEKNMISRSDVSFPISDANKEHALEMAPDANIITAFAGVDPIEWRPENIERDPYEMILATTYDWVHNVDGLKWFLDNVLPKIKEKYPGSKLTLLGKNPPAWLETYKEEGVDLKGYVPEVQPYYNKANVFIVPLFVGSGLRIKILEAMAMELPVVSTHLGAEGNKCGENDGLFRADDAVGFAEKIIDLFDDFQMARDLGGKARKAITENYSWENCVNIILKEYEKLV